MMSSHLAIGSINTLNTTPTQNTQDYYFSQSYNRVVDKYMRNIRAMNKSTAYEYYFRLKNFQNFVANDYMTTLDNLIMKIREGRKDPYDILSNYVIYLRNNSGISP